MHTYSSYYFFRLTPFSHCNFFSLLTVQSWCVCCLDRVIYLRCCCCYSIWFLLVFRITFEYSIIIRGRGVTLAIATLIPKSVNFNDTQMYAVPLNTFLNGLICHLIYLSFELITFTSDFWRKKKESKSKPRISQATGII